MFIILFLIYLVLTERQIDKILVDLFLFLGYRK